MNEPRRRAIAAIVVAVIAIAVAAYGMFMAPHSSAPPPTATGQAATTLANLAIKASAPHTGYARTQFGDGWQTTNGCDTRERILQRDLTNDQLASDGCNVQHGTLQDPYTGKTIDFTRGATTSQAVQIDHVVALSDAWQTGAQQFTPEERQAFANDPLELLAVDGPANTQKSDGDASQWLPPNKAYDCQYVARQIAVKIKYHLWLTQAEHDAMQRTLTTCPGQQLPVGG
jgi:hypothetical protein